ncbi:MAG: SBBP repeat-containing protein [Bacteroidetes bacterium]|nr:SBBP repeat-containing protein [Bacteroidota bacterium]
MTNADSFLKNQPVLFTENRGQLTDTEEKQIPGILYTIQTPGINLYITEKGLTYFIITSIPGKNNDKTVQTEWNRFDMTLKGATIKKDNISTEGKSTHFKQYFLAHCQDGITDVHSYEKIIIKNIYPNIDWILYNSNDKGFKYDFIVHPGGNAKHIQMAYISKNPILVNKKGELEITNALGDIKEKSPVSFMDHQEINSRFVLSQQHPIELNNDHGYESVIVFDFPKTNIHHLNSDLIIDPQLVWGTFFGSYNTDIPTSIATDKSGNVYVTGNTSSIDIQTQSSGGYFQGVNNGGAYDVFIVKFSNNGNLLWSTYYGGNDLDDASSITTDIYGNVFVTGITVSPNFPVLNNGGFFQAVYGGGWDPFILKFNGSGVRLWATYYGGESSDAGYSITTDNNGNVFVTGFSYSANFPTYNSGTYFQGTTVQDDVFILKFDNNGNRLWATFYGGMESDRGMSITTDLSGNVLVTGHTSSSDLPVPNNGGTSYSQPLSPAAFTTEIFITKFSNNGTLLWGTFYGGNDHDIGYSIITDRAGNIFVSGYTGSLNFPVFNPGGTTYFQPIFGGYSDSFILKFNATGTRLWATYYGGSRNEANNLGVYNLENMLALDACENLYLFVDTKSNDMPLKTKCTGGYQVNSLSGTSDGHLSSFTNSGELLWATYIGGDGNDFSTHMAMDASNNLFITEAVSAVSINSSYPIQQSGTSYISGVYSGSYDAVISKLKPVPLNNTMSYVNPTNCQCNGSASISTNGCPPFNYYWSNGTSVLNTTLTSTSLTGLCPGVYEATVTSNCDTYVASVSLTNVQTMVASINPVDSITCTHPTRSLTTSVSAPSYTWSGPGVISGGNTATAIVNAPGNYTLTISDANGCSSTATINVYQSSNTPDVICGSTGTISCYNPVVNLDFYSVTPLITYTWVPTNATTHSISVTSGGTYTIFITNPANGCVSSCTTEVTENTSPPMANASNTTTLTCLTTNATLSGNGTGYYTWAGPGIVSGTNSPNPVVNAPGIYTLTVTDFSNGCTATATTSVTQQILTPTVTISNPDTLTCFINTVTISGSATGTYLWSGPGIVSGANTNQITVNQPGIYTLSVTNTIGCTTTVTTQVIQALDTPTLMVSPNVVLLSGEQTTIFSGGGSNFTWLPNGGISCLTCTSNTVAPLISTSYCAQTSAGSCTTQACVTVTIKELCAEPISYSVPNALSPNGDGLNDELCLRGWENCVKSFYIAIYDRWGEKVYESIDPGFCWDGKYNGKILSPDVFMYYIKAEMTNGSNINKKGDITLIR